MQPADNESPGQSTVLFFSDPANPSHALAINCMKSLSLSGICVNLITKL